jgi:hypothetical protein
MDTPSPTVGVYARLYFELILEVPDLVEDGKRVACGERPHSEIFKRTADVLARMEESDPSLKAFPEVALLAAARIAKLELETEQKSRLDTSTQQGDEVSCLPVLNQEYGGMIL